MVTNSSGERSVSRLKRIKSDLRASMGENRLSSLTLMSIEVDKLREIQTQDTLYSLPITLVNAIVIIH